ncbi:MAG: PEP/pyruvate-binding domain-containing protein [Acidimicrobiia bacterium]
MALSSPTVLPLRQAVRQAPPGAASAVVPLDGSGHTTPEVGGKASSLDTLVKEGFPVPPAAAVTTHAYRAFVDRAGLDKALARLRPRLTGPPAAGDDAFREVEEAFATATMTPELADGLRAAAGQIAGGRTLAVRSSATTEDLADSSFAGQHLSVLDVVPDDVEAAVRRVWASLWHPSAVAYRDRTDHDDSAVAMAVVIQRLVPAERSGVCFTRDPARPDVVRVESVAGLGEALVSGQATPDTYQLARATLRLINGCSPPAHVREVARAALLVEELVGSSAQDVEWSLADSKIWVLQSRPITTGAAGPSPDADGFDTEPRPGDDYAPAGVSEMLPGVLTPLEWTVNGPMLEDAFRQLLDRLGVLPDGLEGPFGFVGRIRGQAALNLSVVKRAARRMAGTSGAEIERQYLGEVVTETGPEPPLGFFRRIGNLGTGLRALRLRRQAEADAELFERSVARVLEHRVDLHSLRSPELLAYRARVRDLAATGYAAEISVAVGAVATYRALEIALTRWTGDKGPEWAQRVTRDAAAGTAGACTNAVRLWRVYAHAADTPDLAAAIQEGTPEDVESRLRAAGTAGDEFVETLMRDLDGFGSAAVYGGRTWSEKREDVWAVVLGCLRGALQSHDDPGDASAADAATDLAELERTLTRTWKWRVVRTITGQIVDLRRRMLRRLAANARTLLRRRETVKAALLSLGGEERRSTLELADRITRAGALRSADEVELLTDWELEELAAGRPTTTASERDRRARALAAMRAAPPLPPIMRDGHALELAAEGEGDLRGWGASPGRYQGKVRVARTTAEARDLQSGEILVAPATDPSWTPLFLLAGAVVVERGGTLSHAAIVARELGLPAVLNARKATERLRTGDTVEVDGSEGVVRLAAEPEAA